MSVISGGIFSKPRGKTGGIVFGAARTRNGKLATARELVKPSNPNTADQQVQRNKFRSTLDLVRRFGASIYQTAWNRSIGQLPGFQSMMSIFLNQMDTSMDLTLVNEINLGVLHFSDSFAASDEGGGEVSFSWGNDTGSNGTILDTCTILMSSETDANRELTNGVAILSGKTRDHGGDSVAGLIPNSTYEYYAYFVGAGTAEGLYSVAKPYSIDLGA